jgi:hypothetical protein
MRFDATRGFFLNGKPVKIKWTCNHQDYAGVGAALPDRLQWYRLAVLKESCRSDEYRFFNSHRPMHSSRRMKSSAMTVQCQRGY